MWVRERVCVCVRGGDSWGGGGVNVRERRCV